MLETALLGIVAILDFIAIFSIFVFKDIFHSGIALAFAFLFNSIAFVVVGQPLLAIIQLFILIGGISTYLILGVASYGLSNFRHSNRLLLAILSVVIFIAMSYPLIGTTIVSARQNYFTGTAIPGGIVPYVAIYYLAAFMVFTTSIGSLLLLKRIGAKK